MERFAAGEVQDNDGGDSVDVSSSERAGVTVSENPRLICASDRISPANLNEQQVCVVKRREDRFLLAGLLR
jgi:hypothetical protein